MGFLSFEDVNETFKDREKFIRLINVAVHHEAEELLMEKAGQLHEYCAATWPEIAPYFEPDAIRRTIYDMRSRMTLAPNPPAIVFAALELSDAEITVAVKALAMFAHGLAKRKGDQQ